MSEANNSPTLTTQAVTQSEVQAAAPLTRANHLRYRYLHHLLLLVQLPPQEPGVGISTSRQNFFIYLELCWEFFQLGQTSGLQSLVSMHLPIQVGM